MDAITLIVTALADDAASAVHDEAADAVKVGYARLQDAARRSLATQPDMALLLAHDEADREVWKESLAEALTIAGAENDAVLIATALAFLKLTDSAGARAGKYSVTISGSEGTQAGEHNTQVNYFIREYIDHRKAAKAAKPKTKTKATKKRRLLWSVYIGGTIVLTVGIICSLLISSKPDRPNPACDYTIPTALGAYTIPACAFSPLTEDSTYPAPGLFSSVVSQTPCTGKTESPEVLPGLEFKNSLFSDSIYRPDWIPSTGVAFPQKIELSPADEQNLAGQDWERWFLDNQGYDAGSSVFDLTITGRTPFTILQMQAFVIRCTPSAATTLLVPPPAGGAMPVIGIGFELGSRNNAAFEAGNPHAEYFHQNTFQVHPGDAPVFQVTAFANGDAFEWEIAITVSAGKGIHTFLVNQYGKPFLTTDFPPAGKPYRAIYELCGDLTIKSCSHLPSSYWVKVLRHLYDFHALD